MRSTSNRATVVIASSLIAPLVLCAVLAQVRDEVANTNAALVLVLVIVASAATGDRRAGIGAALSSGVWFDFFLTQPYQRLTITDRADIETMVLLLLVGVAVSEIALWGRRQQARSSRRDGYLDGIVSAARLVADGSAPPSVLVEHLRRQIIATLSIDDCRFDTGTGGGHPRLNMDGSVTRDTQAVDVERDGLPADDQIELLVENAGRVVGRFLLTASTLVSRPSLQQRLVAVTLAQQIGAAARS